MLFAILVFVVVVGFLCLLGLHTCIGADQNERILRNIRKDSKRTWKDGA